MCDFGSFASAARFCSDHDVRDHSGSRQQMNETLALVEQRRLFREHWSEACALLRDA